MSHGTSGRRARRVSTTMALVTMIAVSAVTAFWMLSSPAATISASLSSQSPAPVLGVQIIRELPHSTTAYTQGLLWSDGRLYESTGQYGRSRLSRIDPANGAVEQTTPIPPALFGEGLARVGNELFMLTWKAQRAIVYDLETFEPRRTYRYTGEGWGLCHDGRRLVMSNGSDRLVFRDPETFDEIGSVAVTLDGAPVRQLNELECVGDRVYSNIYQDDRIVVIDPVRGDVTHVIDASGLLTREEARAADVLNGIAHDPEADTFYITGKLWPTLFEVRFVE